MSAESSMPPPEQEVTFGIKMHAEVIVNGDQRFVVQSLFSHFTSRLAGLAQNDELATAIEVEPLGGTEWTSEEITELRRLRDEQRELQIYRDSLELSPREVDVIKLAAQGLSNDEIAQNLYISPHTVSSHLERISKKMGTGDRVKIVGLYMGTLKEQDDQL